MRKTDSLESVFNKWRLTPFIYEINSKIKHEMDFLLRELWTIITGAKTIIKNGQTYTLLDDEKKKRNNASPY